MRFLIVLLVACSSATPTATTPRPRGTIAELEYFVGTWHADAHDPGTGKRFELEYRVEPALRGRWYIGTGFAAALDLEIHDLWGKDPVSGEIVRTLFDSAQTIGTVRSKGWSGDTLVLEGDAHTAGGAARVRETITRKGPDEFHAIWEARTGDTWQPYSVETLRRIK